MARRQYGTGERATQPGRPLQTRRPATPESGYGLPEICRVFLRIGHADRAGENLVQSEYRSRRQYKRRFMPRARPSRMHSRKQTSAGLDKVGFLQQRPADEIHDIVAIGFAHLRHPVQGHAAARGGHDRLQPTELG